MELFDKNGCLTDEGLQALQAGGLDELGRLETAEHLSYCDKCMDRYTALLTADALETPPHSAHKAVMAAIWVRLMQNTWGRAAVAGVAAVLAFTMWRSGTIDQLLNFRQELHTWTPETSQSQTEEALQLGKPQRSIPGQWMIWCTDKGNRDLAKLPESDGCFHVIFQDAE